MRPSSNAWPATAMAMRLPQPPIMGGMPVQCYQTGYQTITAEVMCCPDCGSLTIQRRSSRNGRAHWRCRCCDRGWTESHTVGLGKSCNGKLAGPESVDPPCRGSARREASLRCCAGCASTRVRATARCGRIAYWSCERCALGWTELAESECWSGSNVKLASG